MPIRWGWPELSNPIRWKWPELCNADLTNGRPALRNADPLEMAGTPQPDLLERLARKGRLSPPLAFPISLYAADQPRAAQHLRSNVSPCLDEPSPVEHRTHAARRNDAAFTTRSNAAAFATAATLRHSPPADADRPRDRRNRSPAFSGRFSMSPAQPAGGFALPARAAGSPLCRRFFLAGLGVFARSGLCSTTITAAEPISDPRPGQRWFSRRISEERVRHSRPDRKRRFGDCGAPSALRARRRRRRQACGRARPRAAPRRSAWSLRT